MHVKMNGSKFFCPDSRHLESCQQLPRRFVKGDTLPNILGNLKCLLLVPEAL